MPYATLEKKISMVPPQYLSELSDFVDFIILRHGDSRQKTVAQDAPRLRTPRKLGGFEEGFYMAPDFDDPVEDFKEGCDFNSLKL